MNTGLTEKELGLMRGVLGRHGTVTGAILFGSRAKGMARPSSDVDLALCGTVGSLEAEAIATELDELPMPYRFDVLALPAIQDKALREHIDRVGVRIH